MALTAMLSFVLVSLLHLVGNGFEFERWLKGLKYLIHDARHASYLLQIERYGAPYCERDCSPALVFSRPGIPLLQVSQSRDPVKIMGSR